MKKLLVTVCGLALLAPVPTFAADDNTAEKPAQPKPAATPRVISLRNLEEYREALEKKLEKGTISKEKYREGIEHYKRDVERFERSRDRDTTKESKSKKE